MHSTLLALLLFVASAYPQIPDGPPKGYHMLVGIPAAERIKAREDAILSKETSRIWGGYDVDGERYPFFAGLIITFPDTKPFSTCGSSLLSANRLVTLAHCWYDGYSEPDQMTVVLDSEFLTYGGLRIDTKEVVSHKDYDYFTRANDIAMIYLPYKVNFTNTIFPIALPMDRGVKTFSGQMALAIGYGVTSSATKNQFMLGPSLQDVNLEIISNDKCDLTNNDELCTSQKGGVGPCHGDYGGPLITYDHRKYLVGLIQSISKDRLADVQCGTEPAIYVRVSNFLDFLHTHGSLPNFTFKYKKQGSDLVEHITITTKREHDKVVIFNQTVPVITGPMNGK